ncbi:MAG TPA: PQQ-binding-like beta-propeller repeat protein [Vicinamibacterales bacterium]|nr:PQQ-binding-like beta-propeller repeat protein [Vicinamibacterales bacterium]
MANDMLGATTLAVMALGGALTLAQSSPGIAPLRTTPVEKFTVNPGFRDWAPTVRAGTTIIGGNSSNRGGLFAVDAITGKLKWTFRPTGTAIGNPVVVTAPAVSGGLAIAPMGNTLVAVTIATGREAWRGPATAQSAAVAADGGMAFVLGEHARFHALDAATGRERWAVPFPRSGSCDSVPVARDGIVFVARNVVVTAGDANCEYFNRGYPLRRFVPHIQKNAIAGSGNVAPAFPSRTIQRCPHLFLGVCQFCQWHLERDAVLYLIEIRQDPGHNRFVLSIATLRHINLRHALEVHRHLLARTSHAHSLSSAASR